MKRHDFKNILIDISKYSMDEQKKILENYYYTWKGNEEQNDDILVIGVRIK
jgi:hypothetical protein